MPIPSPFHDRLVAQCVSYQWKDWAGFHAVARFDTCHDREYYAFRHSAGLLDVTPLFKYRVEGPDAGAFLSRVMVKDIAKMRRGRVTYCCWCDDDGKILDDGTVSCFAPGVSYRVTSAEPTLRWFQRCQRGFDVEIEDVTSQIGALALQGPTSRAILKDCSDVDVDKMRFFRVKAGMIDDCPVQISRTGYTGDLGYEVWVDAENAGRVYDALLADGAPHGILPAGLDALDMTRIEAGFILAGVDYFAANTQIIEPRKSTPYELDLGWTIDLDRDPFIGQRALRRELEEGSLWAFVCLDIDWDELEALYNAHELPPALSGCAWRTAIPVYADDGRQIGQATSGTWSPTLKKNLALASIYTPWAALGTQVKIEQTVEFVRHRVTATVVPKPAFDPPRKRTTPGIKKRKKGNRAKTKNARPADTAPPPDSAPPSQTSGDMPEAPPALPAVQRLAPSLSGRGRRD